MNHEVTDDMRRFQVTVYDISEINNTFSKGRVRIFYKGINRNRTYISDAFAEELISSLPYTPIKGIFNEENMDFEDHGWDSREGKIYGIVPENPHFAWENFEDEDGVERSYACADVYLFTCLYPEARLIQGKSQSMEIYDKSMKGHWTDSLDGELFVFDHGSLLGLQILGDNIEPCFEGAAFYSLSQSAQELISYIKKLENEVTNNMEKEKEMELNAAEDTSSRFSVIEKNDKNGICFDSTTQEYVVVHFLDNDEIQETVRFSSLYDTLKTQEQAIADMAAKLEELQEVTTFEEEQSLAQKELSSDEEVGAENTTVEESFDCETFQNKITELENQIAQQKSEIFKLLQEKDDIIKERDELQTFKDQAEFESKHKILEEFSKYLSTAQITQYTEQLNKFTVDELKKELCVTAYDSGRMQTNEKDLVYKLQENEKVAETGVMGLLNKHKNRG